MSTESEVEESIPVSTADDADSVMVDVIVTVTVLPEHPESEPELASEPVPESDPLEVSLEPLSEEPEAVSPVVSSGIHSP